MEMNEDLLRALQAKANDADKDALLAGYIAEEVAEEAKRLKEALATLKDIESEQG